MNLIKCWRCDKSMTINKRSKNDGDCIHCGAEIEMDLDFRRANNIFEVGDLITHPVFCGLFEVKEIMKHHVVGVTPTGYESKLAMVLIKHATPEEIKAGKRI